MLDEKQQFERLLDSAKHVLVCFSQGKNIDAIASALALKKFLETKKTQVDIVCDNYEPIKNLKFIDGYDKINKKLSNLQKLIIKVDLSKTKIDTLSYDIKDNWLSIHINPKEGIITKQDLRTAQTALKYDFIITINTQDLDSLGEIFSSNTDLFYTVPIINIDNQLGNEHYGQLNFCSSTVASNSEIVYEVMKKIDETKISTEIANCILTGMISSTRSFKNSGVTPRVLNKAGELMDLGADRDQIIKYLYQTRSISTLKLWGKALTRIKIDPEIGLVWTILTTHDFIDSGADKDDLEDIIEELISNTPEAKIVLILHESNKFEVKDKIHGSLMTDKQFDAKEILNRYNPIGSKHKVNFIVPSGDLIETESKIVEIIKKAVIK